MNLAMTDEQRMLRDTLSRYLADVTDDPWAGLGELGMIGVLFGRGAGEPVGGGIDLLILFEEVGRAGADLALIDNALLPGRLLAAAGGDIEPLIAGAERLAFAGGELAAGYEPAWVETRADGNRITGTKTVVMGGQEADRLIVSARRYGAPDARTGIGLWQVARDAPGLFIRGYDLAQGGRAAEITFSDTPGAPLMREAFAAIAEARAAATLALMAETLGAMETVFAMTRDYLATRKQFGRAIVGFQTLAHRLVDMALALEQARSVVLMAAGHLKAPADRRDLAISAAKNLMGRAGRLVAEEAIQMHGAIAMTEDYALGHFAKRIIMADHRFGDTDYHLERFIAGAIEPIIVS